MPLLEEVLKGGVHKVDRAFLHQIPLPAAGLRTRWEGIQHGQLANELIDQFLDIGFIIKGEEYALTSKGQHMFGYIHLDIYPDDVAKLSLAMGIKGSLVKELALDLISLRAAISHSNDSTLALRLHVLPVFKETGNAIAMREGSISLYKRHTKGIKKLTLQRVIADGVDTFAIRCAKIGQEIAFLKESALDKKHGHDMICQAGVNKIIPWSTLGKVAKDWEDGANAWDLYNAFTMQALGYHIGREIVVARKIHELIVDNITPTAPQEKLAIPKCGVLI